MTSISLDLFGRPILAVRTPDGWTVFHIGPDGKRRPASEILVPPFIGVPEIERYLADLCHEWATKEHPEVQRLDGDLRDQGFP